MCKEEFHDVRGFLAFLGKFQIDSKQHSGVDDKVADLIVFVFRLLEILSHLHRDPHHHSLVHVVAVPKRKLWASRMYLVQLESF